MKRTLHKLRLIKLNELSNQSALTLRGSLSSTSIMPLKNVSGVDAPATEPRRSGRIATKPAVTLTTQKVSKKGSPEETVSAEAEDGPSSSPKNVELIFVP